MLEQVKQTLREGIAELDQAGVLSAVPSSLDAGDDTAVIIATCEEGMRLVGERYEQREYYLSGLIMAGEIFREVLEITRPAVQTSLAGIGPGKVVLGTVQGDINDIGKSILKIALRAFGFTVEDLGVDVPPQAFVDKALAWRPDVIGLSGLLTSAYETMRETVRLLRAQPAPGAKPIPVIIGGGTLPEHVRAYVGADYWCNDALAEVQLCQQLIAARHSTP